MFVYERLAIYEVFFIYLQWEVEGMQDPDVPEYMEEFITCSSDVCAPSSRRGGARNRGVVSDGTLIRRVRLHVPSLTSSRSHLSFFRSPRASSFSSSSFFPFILIKTNILLILDITYSCLIRIFLRVRNLLTDSEFNAFVR